MQPRHAPFGPGEVPGWPGESLGAGLWPRWLACAGLARVCVCEAAPPVLGRGVVLCERLVARRRFPVSHALSGGVARSFSPSLQQSTTCACARTHTPLDAHSLHKGTGFALGFACVSGAFHGCCPAGAAGCVYLSLHHPIHLMAMNEPARHFTDWHIAKHQCSVSFSPHALLRGWGGGGVGWGGVPHAGRRDPPKCTFSTARKPTSVLRTEKASYT